MLVIVSDLHLTDGTTGLRISPGAFRVFQERLESMAYDASKRADGRYDPIREFDLLFLGDIFDILRSTKWTNEGAGEIGYARPWSPASDSVLLAKVEQIVEGILANNAESAEILRNLARGTGISLPPPTKAGQVDRRVSRDRRSKQRLPIQVNIHYMNGNHDWLFHLPGTGFDKVRQKVIDQLGLCNPPTPFAHEPGESPAVQFVLAQHQVFARHGDIFDPFSYSKENGRNASCIGDALVVELFNRVPNAIQTELGKNLSDEFYADLAEMGSVRPGTMTPVWVAGLLDRHQIEKKYRQAINGIWRQLLDKFLTIDYLSKLDKYGFDMVDALEMLFAIFRGISLEKLSNYASAAEKLIHLQTVFQGGGEMGFEKHASQESACQLVEARFIVYGHTHGCKVVPLRSQQKNGKPYDQLYINSGTWHPLHELGKFDPEKRSFIPYKTMSYLGFYHSSERKGRLFETWSGTLDL